MQTSFFLALINFILSLFSSDTYKVNDVVFDDNHRELWFRRMEVAFNVLHIAPENRTVHAITVGLNNTADPELQMVMKSRLDEWSARNLVWSWDQFQDDITQISNAAKAFRATKRRSYFGTSSLSERPVNADLEKTINDGSVDSQATLSLLDAVIQEIDDRAVDAAGIHRPHIKFPWNKDTLDSIRKNLERTRKDVVDIIERGSAKVPDVARAVHDFITSQIALLPDEIKAGIVKLNKFREEHPYIAAAAITVLSLALSEFVFVPAALSLLRLAGFTAMGPLAGSWAALVQSVFYGARTRGLFSVIQSITMGAKNFWPVAVFLDISAIAAGMALWTATAVKAVVEQWRTEIRPDMKSMIDLVVDEKFMVEVGERCKAAGIPEVQWLTVAFQFVTREVEESIGNAA